MIIILGKGDSFQQRAGGMTTLVINKTMRCRFIIRTDEHTHIHTRMHVHTVTYHSPPVYQRSLICTQVHDHVRKIEIARYCRHEGIP